jgi:hypothetical protein
MRPARKDADEHQDENDKDNGSKRHGLAFVAGLEADVGSSHLRVHSILAFEIDAGESDQRAVSWVVDRLDTGNALREIRMVTFKVDGQLRLGACWTRDQDSFCIRDRFGNLLEEIQIRGRVAAAGCVRLVMDVPRRIVRMDDHTIGYGRFEEEDFRFPVIDPNNRVIMRVHGSRFGSYVVASPLRRFSSRTSRYRIDHHGPVSKSTGGSETT